MGFFRRRKKNIDDDIIEGEIEEIHDEEDDSDPESSAEPTTRPPLERVSPDIPTPDETAAPLMPYVPPVERESEFLDSDVPDDEPPPRPQRRRRLPRLLAWDAMNPSLLLLSVGLVAGGIFWTLHNLGETSAQAEQWWPAALLGLAMVWALVALITKQGGRFLAASGLVGISISLLLDTQDLINWEQTLLGSILIVLGMGIVARGLLLRQGSVAR